MYEKYEMIKDYENYRRYRITRGYGAGQETQSKKATCIGGDFNGQRVTRIDLGIAGVRKQYYEYNRAGWTKDGRDTIVFIHHSFLDGN
jgi:hypothetical protein